jgi:hypothetical protein
LFVCLSVCVLVCLFVYLFVCLMHFGRLIAFMRIRSCARSIGLVASSHGFGGSRTRRCLGGRCALSFAWAQLGSIGHGRAGRNQSLLQGWMLEVRRLDTMISHLKVRRGDPRSAVEYPEYLRCSTNGASAAKRRSA